MEWEGIEQVKNGLNSADRVKKVFKEKVSVGASGCQGFFEWWRTPFLWTEIVLCYQWASRVLYLCDYRGTGRTLLVWKNGVGVGGKVKKMRPQYTSQLQILKMQVCLPWKTNTVTCKQPEVLWFSLSGAVLTSGVFSVAVVLYFIDRPILEVTINTVFYISYLLFENLD